MKIKKKILIVLLVTLTLLLFLLCFSKTQIGDLMHLDFSQSYRKIPDAEKIVFCQNYNGKPYRRALYGLKSVPSIRAVKDTSKSTDADIEAPDCASTYIVSDSGNHVAWYDYTAKKICIATSDRTVIREVPISYYWGNQLVFSPDEKYLLYQENDVLSGYTTDDEDVYYRVVNIESGNIITIYEGYRQYFNLYWSSHA